VIVVVDYGMSNLRSVRRGLEAIGAQVRVINEPRELVTANGIVLPGDGAFGQTMDNLTRHGWIGELTEAIGRGVPFLGICLGMQLLFDSSEEMGENHGLGILRGSVRKFPHGKVPQIGWNQLRVGSRSRLLAGVTDGSYAYFVHSYYCDPEDSQVVAAQTEYGIEYASVVEWENVWGAQFHPEKSGRDGLKMLRNFAALADP
jgi:glutamine amidotransferase